MASSLPRSLDLSAAGKPVTLQFDELSFSIHKRDENLRLPLRQVLWIEAARDSIEVCCLVQRKKKQPFSLVRLDGTAKDATLAQEFAEAAMVLAYDGVKRCRKLKVLVNPHGGVGKAVSIFTRTIEPILRSARCSIDVTHTTHAKHAYEIAKTLSLDYDAIVTVSGDGIVHEVINGFAHHERSVEAFNIPITPIPTGSGNGLFLNLLGVEHGFDVSVAALNAIKGQPMKADLFSITRHDTKTYSFMSQAVGLMADIDIKTENLRWMGDTRFFVGLFQGLAQFKACPAQLSIQLAAQDKEAMVRALQSRRTAGSKGQLPTTSGSFPEGDHISPQLRLSPEDGPGWYIFDRPILYVFAGQGPYVGRDLMAFPVSLPDDGLIDISVQELSSRGDILGAIGGADKGQHFWKDSHHYFKARAYRMKPLTEKGILSIDGENFPFTEFQVEVHPLMVSFLSPLGTYAAQFPSAEYKPGNKSG